MSAPTSAPRIGARTACAFVALVTLGSACAPHRVREPESARRPAWLVGSWAFVPAEESAAPPRDSTVWEFTREGRLRRGRLRRGRVRVESHARWWTEPRQVGGESTRVLCTTDHPGRGYQCARIHIDSVTTPEGTARRRLTWDGLTFRHHWVFVERRPGG